jgi:hypothetical protein
VVRAIVRPDDKLELLRPLTRALVLCFLLELHTRRTN